MFGTDPDGDPTPDPVGSAIWCRRTYTSGPDEAHLPTEEAQAGQNPRLPRADEHSGRPRAPEPPSAQRAQAAHPLDGQVAVLARLDDARDAAHVRGFALAFGTTKGFVLHP